MENTNENVNEEVVDEEVDETSEDTDWKAEALKQKAINKRLKTKMEKKAEAPENESETSEKEVNQDKSNYSDLVLKTYLKGEGIDFPEGQKFLIDEAKRLGKNVDEIVSDGYYKSKIKDMKDQKTAEAGAPKGGEAGGSKNSQDVDYYVKSGKEVPAGNLELAKKVIDAKCKTEESGSMFSERLY